MAAKRSLYLAMALFLALGLALTGCKKKKKKRSKKPSAEEEMKEKEDGPAMARLIHLSPDLGPTTLIVDARPPSKTDELTWFEGSAPMLSLPSGWQRLSLEHTPDPETPDKVDVQHVKNLKIKAGAEYWAVVSGMRKPRRGDKRLDIRMVPTRGFPKEPNDKMATVRVLNASTNMPPLDATLRQVNDGVKSSEELELYVNIGFAKATTYRQVEPTNAKIEFRSGLDKRGKPLYVSEKFELLPGVRYTVLLMGRQGSSKHPLDIRVLDETLLEPPLPEEEKKDEGVAKKN